jgi:polysaccharide pyruvyl transferase WcaK-like protein
VRVAPYDSGPAAADEAFGAYLACDVVLAMRFHSNIVPIGHGIPAIGLYCYDQIKRLYDELESPDSLVAVSQPGFGAALLDRLRAILENPDMAKARAAAMKALVTAQRDKAGRKISTWLQHDRFA